MVSDRLINLDYLKATAASKINDKTVCYNTNLR